MRRLSILFVTGRFPLPLRTGDRARAYQQVRLLARRHRVTLATFLDASPSAQDARAEIERLGVRVVSAPFSGPAAALRVVRSLPGTQPLQVALFDAPSLRAAIADLLARETFDLIHVQLARAVPLVPADVDVPVFVDLVDALSLNMRRRAEHDHGPMAWAAAVDSRRMAAYEREVIARADGTSVVTAVDRAALATPEGVAINPNGVDVADFPFVAGPREPDHLVFTGNLGYFPNVEAVTWFAREVLPRIWRMRPACRLVIAGARPHRRVRALAHDPRVLVEADVAHMHPFLARASVAVAPMFTGSGQLLKVLEAMATGTPVVATTRALNGLDVTPGVHACVGDTPDAFATEVLRLLDSPAESQRLADAARALVASRCTWEQAVQQLEHLHAAVAAAPVSATA